ncbi:hypothetical protein Golob_024026, partial [Gossypium lobatum]|nr:hypothetical protein [Gossypium lobatum]
MERASQNPLKLECKIACNSSKVSYVLDMKGFLFWTTILEI